MTRPRHVYLLDPDQNEDEDSQSSQPGSIASTSRTIRRVPSYRPLPIPGASMASQSPVTSAPAVTPTTTSASTRPLPSVLPLSIPTRPSTQPTLPSSPTRPNGPRESSSPPSSPQSPAVTAAVATSWQRYRPRSDIRIPSAVESSSPDGVDGGMNMSEISHSSLTRLAISATTTTTMTLAQPCTRVVRPKAKSPTSPTFATSLASISVSTSANVHSTSSSLSTSAGTPPTVPSNHSATTSSSASMSVSTTSTSPPSSFPLPSSTPIPDPTHRLTRKSRSKLNLRSQSSQNTLRSKRSKASLAPPPSPIPAPSPEVLMKRGQNINPHKVFVNRLPPELLSAVFLLLISSSSSGLSGTLANTGGTRLSIGGGANTTVVVDTKAPRTVSQVCHFWRCVALNEPLLWARTLNLREGPGWIIETLKRSGECTIDVIGLRDGSSSTTAIRLPGGGSDGNSRNRTSDDYSGFGRGAPGRTSVLGVVLNELKRIRKLHLTIERKEEWRWFLDVLMKEEAPVLESLAVKSLVGRVTSVSPSGGGGYDGHGSRGGSFGGSFGGGGLGMGFDVDLLGLGAGDDPMKLTEGMFKGKAPKLKSLSLSMVSLSTLSPLPYLSSLTALQITDLEDTYQMTTGSWLSIVRQTPLLHTLILRSVFSPEIPTESEIESPSSQTSNVVLKKLRFIELKGTLMECCEFLEKLVVPGECKLMMGCNRANNANAAVVLGDWMRERKRRSEHMEGILKSPWEVMKESSERRGRSLLIHPSVTGLVIKVNEGGREAGVAEEDEGECVVNLDLAFGCVDPQSEERHRIVIEIFNILTRALQMVYEDKGGFDTLNLSLFGVRDGIRFWGDELVQFLAWLDRVEHLQEISGYTASIVFPLLAHSPQQQHQRRGSAASINSIGSTSTSPAERFRQSVLLPLLSKVTLAFVEFGENVDDEFEASCDVHAVSDFVGRRYGLVGGLSVVRQRVGSVKVQFECCSGPKGILDELKRLGVEYGLGWACDFD